MKINNLNVGQFFQEIFNKLSKDVNDYFKDKKYLKYSIESNNGTIWSNLSRKKLISTYSVYTGEYNLIYIDYEEGSYYFRDLITGEPIPSEMYPKIMEISTDRPVIESYIEEEDLKKPAIKARKLKERIENDLIHKYVQPSKLVK